MAHSQRPLALLGARLVDPASFYDGPGGVLVCDGVIADVFRGSDPGPLSADVEVYDCLGHMLSPGRRTQGDLEIRQPGRGGGRRDLDRRPA